MFTTILSQVTGVLDRRFLFNAFFPSLVFALAVGLVVARTQDGLDDAIALWQAQDGTTQAMAAIGGVAALFVFASLVANGWLFLTRMYEGYWPRLIWLTRRAQDWHRGARDRLSIPDRLLRYPEDDSEVRSTRLGNILRAAEVYPARRYRVEPIEAWTRLYFLLPGERRESLVAARSAMESMLVISWLSILFSVLSGVMVAWAHEGRTLFAACVGGGLVLGVIGYRGALPAARAYGSQVAAAFDLHRLDLLKALHMPLPDNAHEERRQWSQIYDLFVHGEYLTGRYEHPK